MTTPEPAEQLRTSYGQLQMSISSLQTKIHMSDARDALEDFDTKINGLPQAVKNLRARKYAFEAVLESQAEEFRQRWATTQPSVVMFIDQQATQLEYAIRPIEAKMSYLAGQMGNPEYALGLVSELEREVENLDDKVSGAVTTASGMYDELVNQFREVDDHIKDVNFTFDQLDQASFKLTPAESAIMAIKATMTRGNKEESGDPQGFLYLTDQRLLFEQKQEVATKKVLFITTERKLVQQLIMETAVAYVTDVKGVKQGLFKNEDYLYLTFTSGAPYRNTQFHIYGQDCQVWAGLINRVRAKEFDKDRVIQVDQAEVEKVKNAPSVCPACGGAINQVVLRGQDTITCEYCGHVIRL